MANRFSFSGALLDAPEIKENTGNGVTVAKFTLMVKKHRPESDGSYKNDFIDIAAFGKDADFLKNRKKGDPIVVDSKMHDNIYVNAEGETVYSKQFDAYNVEYGTQGCNHNSVLISGRLVKDVELRVTAGEKPLSVARFKVAVYRDKERTDFIDCRAFGKAAENLSKYKKKGDSLAVEGYYLKESYADRDGNKRTDHQVIATGIEYGYARKTDVSSGAPSDNLVVEKDFEGFMSVDDDFEIPFN